MTEALTEVRNWTPEERKEAAQVKKELDKTLIDIESQQKRLETEFVKLGTLTNTVQEKKFWLLPEYGQHRSFNQWIKSVEPRIGKGRTRIYASLNIAKQLLPYVPPKELEDIGISKASAIASAVKKSGKKPSDELLNAAKNKKTTVQQVEELIQDYYGARDEFEKGTWYSLQGVYFSDDERDEFERAVEIACRMEPPLPYVVKWQDATAPQRKEVLQRIIMTFLADEEAKVYAAQSRNGGN